MLDRGKMGRHVAAECGEGREDNREMRRRRMVLCVVLIATFFIVFASLIHRASERNNIGWETQRSLPSSFHHPLARVSGITLPSSPLCRRTPFRMIPACLARLFGKLTGFALSLVPDSLRARTHIALAESRIARKSALMPQRQENRTICSAAFCVMRASEHAVLTQSLRYIRPHLYIR